MQKSFIPKRREQSRPQHSPRRFQGSSYTYGREAWLPMQQIRLSLLLLDYEKNIHKKTDKRTYQPSKIHSKTSNSQLGNIFAMLLQSAKFYEHKRIWLYKYLSTTLTIADGDSAPQVRELCAPWRTADSERVRWWVIGSLPLLVFPEDLFRPRLSIYNTCVCTFLLLVRSRRLNLV